MLKKKTLHFLLFTVNVVMNIKILKEEDSIQLSIQKLLIQLLI